MTSPAVITRNFPDGKRAAVSEVGGFQVSVPICPWRGKGTDLIKSGVADEDGFVIVEVKLNGEQPSDMKPACAIADYPADGSAHCFANGEKGFEVTASLPSKASDLEISIAICRAVIRLLAKRVV